MKSFWAAWRYPTHLTINLPITFAPCHLAKGECNLQAMWGKSEKDRRDGREKKILSFVRREGLRGLKGKNKKRGKIMTWTFRLLALFWLFLLLLSLFSSSSSFSSSFFVNYFSLLILLQPERWVVELFNASCKLSAKLYNL